MQVDGLVTESRKEHNRLLEEVERLRNLRRELVSSYTAFLLSALELVKEHRDDAPGKHRPDEPDKDQPEGMREELPSVTA